MPDDPDYLFLAGALPEKGLPRIAIAVRGLCGSIPTALIVLGIDDALRVCDRLNRRLGHDRPSWTAFAARCRRGGHR